ncbi:MAG: DsbA family protein [Aestuariivita sp.]|nr:DsbA family protein [Aestuariivita sp.]
MKQHWALRTISTIFILTVFYLFFPVSHHPWNLLNQAEAQETETDTSSVIEMQLGNPNAGVTVIEYASFTCPHCKTFHEGGFKKLKADYIDTSKINFVFREVYFDRGGLWASMLARCGGADRFFGITDMLFEQQSEWVKGDDGKIADNLQKIGRLVGHNSETLESCFQNREMALNLLAWYKENASEHNVSSTPTFVINGQSYSNMSYEDMREVIDQLLGEG